MIAGYWHQIPFVRIVIPLATGIGISMFTNLPFLPVIGISVFLFSLLLLVWKMLQSKLFDLRFGFLFNLLFLCMGIGLHQSHNHLNYSNHYSYHPAKFLLVEITEPALLKKNSVKCKVSVLQAINGTNTTPVFGNLMLYFNKDTNLIEQLNYGTQLLIKSNYQELKGPQNPFEFNYKRYLAFNQIYAQSYIYDNQFIVIDKNKGNVFWRTAFSAQKFFNQTLQTFVKSNTEIAIAKALLYGYDDEIDSELVRAYSNTGTLHVLAVSGMHVGLIFWLINLVLKYFDKKKYQRVIKAILSLTIIWAYSLLCGLSPSILRASVMFSFVALGNMVKNKPNIYNTLAASAFSLMLVDSNILANVGFQLSFLAVFGIVSLQKYINSWLYFKYKVTKWFWGITSVSIAAQMATFPIGLLYFHQFPVYFLMSNLIIIPITTGIIFVAIALIFVAALVPFLPWLQPLAALLGLLVKWLIWLTNIIVVWLEKLPFSYITGIHISEIETIIIFVGVAYFCNYFISRKQYLAKNALIAFTLFFCIYGFRYYQILNQKTVTVYNINKTFAMQIMNGTKSTLIADSSLLHNPDKIRFHIQQHIWACGITQVDTLVLKENTSIQLPNHKINISNSILPNFTNILIQKPVLTNQPILENTRVIASPRVNGANLQELKTKHILLNNVQENGAITINIEP